MTETNKEEKEGTVAALTCLGAIVFLPLLITVSSLLNGWALTLLWTWFVVPVFHLPVLSVPAAMGIALVAGFLTKQADTLKTELHDSAKIYTGVFSYPLLALGIGWIIHQFAR